MRIFKCWISVPSDLVFFNQPMRVCQVYYKRKNIQRATTFVNRYDRDDKYVTFEKRKLVTVEESLSKNGLLKPFSRYYRRQPRIISLH